MSVASSAALLGSRYRTWVFAPTHTILFSTCAFLLCSFEAAYADETRRVSLAGKEMTIPQRFMDNSMPVWLRLLPGLDDGSREILLEIDAAEVAVHVPGYAVSDGHIRENLRLRAVRLTDVEIQRHREPPFALDAWDGTGLFKKRAIRRDDSTGYYFVVQSADYSISWQVFTAMPEAGTRPHDFLGLWLGGCLEHRGAPPVTSGIPTSCRSFVVFDDLAINFTLGLVNLKHTAAIRTYLAGLAEQWLRN